jgi:hypothetical protein
VQLQHVCPSKDCMLIHLIFLSFLIVHIAITCTGINIRRVYYRFTYSSATNTISAVNVYLLLQPSSTPSPDPRITIVWNDIATNAATSTTIPSTSRCILTFNHYRLF